MKTVVNIHEAKTHLSALIKKVLEGEKVIIARRNIPVIELTPVAAESGKRVAGALKGKIWISEDCWSSDKELENLFYNSQLFPGEGID